MWYTVKNGVRTMVKRIGLSASTLKILACVSMVIDHAGMLLFPHEHWMRFVGRIAFPLFAYFIAEGCQYTRNRLKRFVTILTLGILCEIVYIIADGQYYGNVLLTFSLSVILIGLWQECQRCLFARDCKAILWGGVFCAAVVGVVILVKTFGVDYGIAGVMTPVLIALTNDRSGTMPPAVKRLCGKPAKLLLFTAALLWLTFSNAYVERQAWCLLAVPLVLLYNGKVGKHRLKYGFYLFYPLHLAILQLIAWIR